MSIDASIALPLHRRGVSVGYLAAAAIAVSLWLGVGLLLMPVMLILALLHWWSAPTIDALAAGHHRWLAVHHLLSVGVLLAVLIGPLFALPALWTTASTVVNTLIYAPNPGPTLAAAWQSLPIPTLLLAGFVFVFGWLLASFWISLRLLRSGLRWADGRSTRPGTQVPPAC